jgi:hypothetical protein
MINKPILKSKTFWVQVMALAAVFVPAVQEWLADNPVEFVAALAAVNVLVRFVTSGKISILGDEGGQANGWAWTLIGGLSTLAAVGTLPACAPGESMPIKASVLIEEGRLSYSSKGGLEMEYRPGFGEMPAHYVRSEK